MDTRIYTATASVLLKPVSAFRHPQCRVNGQDIILDKETWFDITYNAIKSIIELASIGKDVYFILYGRPTVRVHRNKIIAMRFVDKKLVHNWTYEDPYSTDAEHVFGTTYSLANDYANKGLKRRKHANKVRIKGRGGAPATGDAYEGPM